jgi:hypothetical protein
MTTYSFVPPFSEATLCGVQSCVFEKVGCATGKRKKEAKHCSIAINTVNVTYSPVK